jgi:hypothetical protein
MWMNRAHSLIQFCGLAAIAFVVNIAVAIPPPVHKGQVLDAVDEHPLTGVGVRVTFDDWPEDSPKPGFFEMTTDSSGAYHLLLDFDNPARVVFHMQGYDSLSLHWPDEFDELESVGCGCNLAPIRLERSSPGPPQPGD